MRRFEQLVGGVASRSVLGVELGAVLLWAGLAAIISQLSGRVADWNAMTDELGYERLAVSVWQLHSIVPHLHGEFVRSLAQLYPVLISPWFAHGYVPQDLHQAHVFNAWLMSSACLPAFLLARRVTERRWVAYAVLLLTVCVPWIIYTTVLITEVAAYPAFLWCVLAVHRAIAAPSLRNDVLGVLGLVLAFFARTQFFILTGVVGLALVAYHLTAPGGGGLRRRLEQLFRSHPVLWPALGACALAALVLSVTGRGLYWLSVYGSQVSTGFFPPGTAGAIPGHAADLAFCIGIVPFVVGLAWLLANVVRAPARPEQHAFACVGAAAIAVFVPVMSAWDLKLGNFTLDRYLYYLVPLLLLAFLCALLDARRPRWSLVFPCALVAFGFATHLQEQFLWDGSFPLSTDSPGAWLYKPIADLGGGTRGASAILVGTTLVAAVLFAAADRFVKPARLTAVAVAALVVGLPLYTGLTFDKLLSSNGHSSRPLTQSQSGVLDWLDHVVGTDGRVTQVPYPISSNFFVSLQFWRDLEFWNKSIRYGIHYPAPDVYADAVIWFPDDPVKFDPQTGAADKTLTPYVVHSVGETRFRIAGSVQVQRNDVMLVRATLPWRTEWLTQGLYDDGWSRPGKPVRVRVFAAPGQLGPVTRTITLHFSPPDGVPQLDYALRSNLQRRAGRLAGGTEARESLQVCVPARGFADVSLSTSSRARIPGDLRSRAYASIPREGGLLMGDISLADELGDPCVARRP